MDESIVLTQSQWFSGWCHKSSPYKYVLYKYIWSMGFVWIASNVSICPSYYFYFLKEKKKYSISSIS